MAINVNVQQDLVPRFVCTSDTKLQTDFARGATIRAILNTDVHYWVLDTLLTQ